MCFMEIGAFLRNMCFMVPLVLWHALMLNVVNIAKFIKMQ